MKSNIDYILKTASKYEKKALYLKNKKIFFKEAVAPAAAAAPIAAAPAAAGAAASAAAWIAIPAIIGAIGTGIVQRSYNNAYFHYEDIYKNLEDVVTNINKFLETSTLPFGIGEYKENERIKSNMSKIEDFRSSCKALMPITKEMKNKISDLDLLKSKDLDSASREKFVESVTKFRELNAEYQREYSKVMNLSPRIIDTFENSKGWFTQTVLNFIQGVTTVQFDFASITNDCIKSISRLSENFGVLSAEITKFESAIEEQSKKLRENPTFGPETSSKPSASSKSTTSEPAQTSTTETQRTGLPPPPPGYTGPGLPPPPPGYGGKYTNLDDIMRESGALDYISSTPTSSAKSSKPARPTAQLDSLESFFND